MVVDTDEVTVGTQPRAHGRARPGPPGTSRRGMLCGLLGSVGALLLTPVVAFLPARHRAAHADHTHADHTHADHAFAETYRGRRIRGVRTPAKTVRDAEGVFHDGQWHVTVDGRPLHLMRRADGTWLSMIDHYCSYATPLEAARAAVDELGPGRHLRDIGGTHGGGHHGVHA
jgi:hypothetical protein